jgi:hypothetical protein
MEGSFLFISVRLQAAHASHARESRPIIDADGLVIGVLGAIPKGDWEGVCQSAVEALEEGRRKLRFSKDQKDHPRGRFSALTAGLSHGGGQSVSTTPARCLCI